jgi:hypothetical protein
LEWLGVLIEITGLSWVGEFTLVKLNVRGRRMG